MKPKKKSNKKYPFEQEFKWAFFLVPLFVFNLQPIRGFLIYLAIVKPGFLFVPIQR